MWRNENNTDTQFDFFFTVELGQTKKTIASLNVKGMLILIINYFTEEVAKF